MNQHQGAAEISRAEGDQVRAQFAASASHMQQGNLTALAQTRRPHLATE